MPTLTGYCQPTRSLVVRIEVRSEHGTRARENEQRCDLQTAQKDGPSNASMIDQKTFWIACTKVSIGLEALKAYLVPYLTLEGLYYVARWIVDVQMYYIYYSRLCLSMAVGSKASAIDGP